MTSLHLLPFLRAAKEKGAELVVVNPVKTKTADLADRYISVRPGTDGALALGLAHVILAERLLDLDFVHNNVHGFAEYAAAVKEYSPATVSSITGVDAKEIEDLARLYARRRPGAILFGPGMQRYANGGQSVRAVDALTAVTGNIGVAGGGANYAHQYNKGLFKDITAADKAAGGRSIPFPLMGRLMPQLDPPLKVAVVTRSNPVCQHPDSGSFARAFHLIDFKVTIDFCLNDTAEASDLFLPCTTIFEEEDLLSSSWSEYLGYAPKLVEPQGEAKPDPVIFSELAAVMGLGDYFTNSSRQWIEEALEPVREKYGITLERLEEGMLKTPLAQEVAWSDRKFSTPSGKIELFSERALQETGWGTACYAAPRESGSTTLPGYPLYLLTPHPARSLHSQFPSDSENYPPAEILADTAAAYNLREGDLVIVESPRGQLLCRVKLNPRLRDDTVLIEEGQWLKSGGGVNLLTPAFLPDMGAGVPYYDCRCLLRKYLPD